MDTNIKIFKRYENVQEAKVKFNILFPDTSITEYECPLGLWGIEGNDTEEIRQAAFWYFFRYYSAGEYIVYYGGTKEEQLEYMMSQFK